VQRDFASLKNRACFDVERFAALIAPVPAFVFAMLADFLAVALWAIYAVCPPLIFKVLPSRPLIREFAKEAGQAHRSVLFIHSDSPLVSVFTANYIELTQKGENVSNITLKCKTRLFCVKTNSLLNEI